MRWRYIFVRISDATVGSCLVFSGIAWVSMPFVTVRARLHLCSLLSYYITACCHLSGADVVGTGSGSLVISLLGVYGVFDRSALRSTGSLPERVSHEVHGAPLLVWISCVFFVPFLLVVGGPIFCLCLALAPAVCDGFGVRSFLCAPYSITAGSESF